MRSIATAWKRLDGIERAATVLALFAVVALAAALRQGGSSSSDKLPSAGEAAVPRCADAKVPARLTAPLVCRSANATLTFAPIGTAVQSGNTALQVQDVRRRDGRVTVRAQVGNSSAEDRSLRRNTRRIYITSGGARYRPDVPDSIPIPAGAAPRVVLRFGVPERAANLQLALVAWREPGTTGRSVLVVPLAQNASGNGGKPAQGAG